MENMAKPGISKQMAAKAAGYTRHTEVTRLLNNETIVARINERKKLAAEFCDISPEQIIGATALRAFATIDDAFDDKGNFDIQKARQTGAIHLIKKIEKTQHGFKVEFYSNETAQEKLGNYLGLDKAPADNNDIASLRQAVNELASSIAGEDPVTFEHKREAWKQISEWAEAKRARYSQEAIRKLNSEYDAQ